MRNGEEKMRINWNISSVYIEIADMGYYNKMWVIIFRYIKNMKQVPLFRLLDILENCNLHQS